MTISANRIRRNQRGFTLLEVMVVMLVFVVTVALAVSPTVAAVRALRIGTDRRAIATTVVLARMRAAAGFTRSRVYAELANRRLRLQTWSKPTATTPGQWVSEGGDVLLHTGVDFGVGSLGAPPANTQPALAQASECLDGIEATSPVIANTACVVFNSRSIPIDGTAAPTANGALWITNGTEVHGVTVSATGLTQSWSAALAGSLSWSKR